MYTAQIENLVIELGIVCVLFVGMILIPSAARADSNQSFTVRTVELRYFPSINGRLNTGDAAHPISLTDGNAGQDINKTKQIVDELHASLVDAINRGSMYHGYREENWYVTPSIQHTFVKIYPYDTVTPTVASPTQSDPNRRRVDYVSMLNAINICDYVDNQGVREVWVWSYGSNVDSPESSMSGKYGAVSNGAAPMPVCSHSYVLFQFNYGRAVANAIESYGHQIEAELHYVDIDLYHKFIGPPTTWSRDHGGVVGCIRHPMQMVNMQLTRTAIEQTVAGKY